VIYGGKASRFDETTGQTQDISPQIIRGKKYRFNRTAPIMFSPTDPHTLYLAANILLKTTDGGHSWQEMSPDLTREIPGVPPSLGTFANQDPARLTHRGVIYALAPSPKDGNLIWAGTDDGLLWVTRDAGKNWANITPPELTPWSKVAQLDASHFDTATAYAAVNRFRLDDLHPYIYRTHDAGKTWQKITEGLPDNAVVNVVREDPERKGLLFAGTERAIWVSFDDGDHWQSLQLNLPATSMRDLVIHGDDIVVGTHGRSFWILDDITPLRQVSAKTSAEPAFLFRPAVTYRIRRNINTDTPLPPEVPAGENPPDGAILDYFLGDGAGPAKLEILDSAGKVVRVFSSTDQPAMTMEALDKTLPVPTYWVRSPQADIPSAQAGMHRFVWDLRVAPPYAVNHEYPISAIAHKTPRYPLGAAVVPGKYTVRLTAGGHSAEQSLEIRLDPRVTATAAALAEQFELESAICEAMNTTGTTLDAVRSIRLQARKLAEKPLQPGHLNAMRELTGTDRRLEYLEGSAVPNGPQVKKESLVLLSADLGTLLAAVDTADSVPTEAEHQTFTELHKRLDGIMKFWNDSLTYTIPAVNEQLRKSEQPPIVVPVAP
jgi:Sortilin, neurotensin receptor 3,